MIGCERTSILASDWLAGVRAVAAQHPAPQAHAGVHQRDEAQLRPQQLGDGRVRQPGAGSGLTCDGSLVLMQGFSHETCAIYDAVLQCTVGDDVQASQMVISGQKPS